MKPYYTHGEMHRVERGYRRYDLWHDDDTPEGRIDPMWAAGPGDNSPTFRGQKDLASCGWCWLGVGHTEYAHWQECKEWWDAHPQMKPVDRLILKDGQWQ